MKYSNVLCQFLEKHPIDELFRLIKLKKKKMKKKKKSVGLPYIRFDVFFCSYAHNI